MPQTNFNCLRMENESFAQCFSDAIALVFKYVCLNMCISELGIVSSSCLHNHQMFQQKITLVSVHPSVSVAHRPHWRRNAVKAGDKASVHVIGIEPPGSRRYCTLPIPSSRINNVSYLPWRCLTVLAACLIKRLLTG